MRKIRHVKSALLSVFGTHTKKEKSADNAEASVAPTSSMANPVCMTVGADVVARKSSASDHRTDSKIDKTVQKVRTVFKFIVKNKPL